eukprot:gnl/TRDRNA2_/TRDRNA2_148977_c3_seq1.p2 gnl/TRDRNA2_/TRDRNA2_148977_c3~~gnl/TRDRNA2_/TRDRNA2_148977_c3_seq1.p2  ORF type:complete len:154 (+),score=39.51 gnl/TRDRNA2_/TRDRNA2_148977_c3_seq1:29-463(+)
MSEQPSGPERSEFQRLTDEVASRAQELREMKADVREGQRALQAEVQRDCQQLISSQMQRIQAEILPQVSATEDKARASASREVQALRGAIMDMLQAHAEELDRMRKMIASMDMNSIWESMAQLGAQIAIVQKGFDDAGIQLDGS